METTLYFGGPIVTLEEPRYAQALVERGGRIAYVGDREEAERLAGPGARRVDLEGRALRPPLWTPTATCWPAPMPASRCPWGSAPVGERSRTG